MIRRSSVAHVAVLGLAVWLGAGLAEAQIVDDIARTLDRAGREICETLGSTRCPPKQYKKKTNARPAADLKAKPDEPKEPKVARTTPVPLPVERSKIVEARAKIDADEQSASVAKVPERALEPAPEGIAEPVLEKPPVLQKAKTEALKPYKPVRPILPSSAIGDSVVTAALPAAPPQKIQIAITPNVQVAAACLKALQKNGASFAPASIEVLDPRCAVNNPVRISSLSTKAGKIDLPGQPILACAFALKFADWIKDEAAPLVDQSEQSPIRRIETGPGFQCRNRNGDASAKLSEHAFGNAIDVASFRLDNGKILNVKNALKPDIQGFESLKRLRTAACESFTTVLGPGANAAHEEHFHFDLAQRKGGYRLCQ
jgi:hypothetical protein